MFCTLCTLNAHLHSIQPLKMLRTWIFINAQEKPICTSVILLLMSPNAFPLKPFSACTVTKHHTTSMHAPGGIQTCTVGQGRGPLAEREVAPWAGPALKLPCLVLVERHRARRTAADIVELAQPTGSCNQSPTGHY